MHIIDLSSFAVDDNIDKQSMNKIMIALRASNMFNMIWLSNSFVTDTTRKTNRKITVVVYL